MSSVFQKDMARDMAEDAALTVQHPRQSLQDDRSPTEILDESPIEEKDTPSGGNEAMFDGLLAALKRSMT